MHGDRERERMMDNWIKINAGFAKERISFLQNKGRVQKRVAPTSRLRRSNACRREP